MLTLNCFENLNQDSIKIVDLILVMLPAGSFMYFGAEMLRNVNRKELICQMRLLSPNPCKNGISGK